MTWTIKPAERGAVIGMTGTGKSTLCTELVRRFLAENPNGFVFIVDSKPRYRAEFLVNGIGVTYRNWVKGDFLKDSLAVFSKAKLSNLFRFSRVIIFQSTMPDGTDVEGYEAMVSEYARELFRFSGPRKPTLFVIDEFYDILSGGLAGIADKPILKTIRAGREKNMAVLAGSQRPRSIPLPILTEASKYYLFQLEFEEDITYLRKHGPPLTVIPSGHTFAYYERLNGGKRIEKLMQLDIPK